MGSTPPELFFFFNDTATTEIYTLSLHDALPISRPCWSPRIHRVPTPDPGRCPGATARTPPTARRTRRAVRAVARSEEHTSELQSRPHLVCRLLLENIKLPASCHSNAITLEPRCT